MVAAGKLNAVGIAELLAVGASIATKSAGRLGLVPQGMAWQKTGQLSTALFSASA